MSKRRKTVDVSYILDSVNAYLAREDKDNEHFNADTRKGAYVMLEQILHETGNYNGFNYVEWLDGGYDRWVKDGQPQDTGPYLGDMSKRRYYARIVPDSDTSEGQAGKRRAAVPSKEFPLALTIPANTEIERA